ncbi:hypothetical protein CMO96_03915, partial [Candidatus Woesebacteria bacterium]|nr:hypothetical protein [Candidatus Woesebacteria bacterium]
MPRKTRKQKMRAQEKRVVPEPVNREFDFSFDGAVGLSKKSMSAKKADKSRQEPPASLAVSALVKTVILAAGMFSLE